MRALTALLFSGVVSGQVPLPDGKGRDAVFKVCGDCHDFASIVSERHTRPGWQAVVDRMATQGAPGMDVEFDAIVAYLAERFGPLNVNQASAKELADYLAISGRQAEAMVHYRKENGAFRDLKSLQKASGMDARTLDRKKDGLAFGPVK